jgi:hypothetical protein
MNKFSISILVLSSALAAPALAFAEDNAPITHAQVEAELVQLETAGYHSEMKDNKYPQGIEAAEQHIAGQQRAVSASLGMPTDGTSASGMRTSIAPINAAKSIYAGH